MRKLSPLLKRKNIVGWSMIIILAVLTFSTVCFAAENSDLSQSCCQEEHTQVFYLTTPCMNCEEIQEVQSALKQLGYYLGEVNGCYDKTTEAAVKKFQQEARLKVDGIFGAVTSKALSSRFETDVKHVSTHNFPKGNVSIVVDADKKKLYLYDDNKIFKVYRVAVGTKKTPTPIGEWKIKRKAKNWGTGFGTRWMGLNVPWGIFGIHGTNKPWSIGSRASHGCVRMFNGDVEDLYEYVKVGTPVKIQGRVFHPLYEERWPVHRGHKGSEVLLVQKGLAAEGYLKGEPDGIFGHSTEVALKNLQKDRGFEVTGQVDTDIWGVLGL